MAFLTLSDGTTTLTVRVRSNAAGQEYQEHGADRFRVFSGEYRMTRRAVFRHWSLTSKYQDDASYLALVALLLSNNLPLTASGDLMDGQSVKVIPNLKSASPIQTATGFRRPIVFELDETLNTDVATAAPWLFLRSGSGYFKDLDKTEPAGVDDHARVWADSSGNNRDAVTRYDSADLDFTLIPQVQQSGTAVRFGDPSYTNGDVIGPTTRRAAYVLPSLSGFSEGEIMIALKAADVPDSDNVGAPLMQLTGGTNGEDFLYKASTGHIVSTFGSDNSYDVGPPGISLTGRYHVINAISSADVWRYALDDETLHEDTSTPDPGWDGSVAVIGERATPSGSEGMWNGWFKHLVLFNSVLTTAQRAAWYAFMNGDTDDPPVTP